MSDNNNIPQKKDSAALALQKPGSLLSITDKILANRTQTKEVSKQHRIGKFIVEDGIATDTETGLTWLRFEHGLSWQNNTAVGETEGVNWEAAFEVAKQFNQQGGYGGFTDWRLPTIDELKTLIDEVKGKAGNYIDAEVFPNSDNSSSFFPWFWSSSPDADGGNSAWIVCFDEGYGYYSYKSDGYAVRLVRSGQ